MIRQGLIEQEVLHEIAMSIGESIELDAMLAECIPVFLRGLGCATAAVLLRDEQDDFYTPSYILPRAAVRNNFLHQAINRSLECLANHETLPIPLCYFESAGLFYYAWKIQDCGALLLGRSSPFRDELFREIAPLVNKLAMALNSCCQYQHLKQAQQSMIQARDDAQAANKAKSHFLATMSHEIRTPLNAVINLSELLLETHLDERQCKLTQGVCEGGRSLLQLVNDVLDFSRIEAGRLELVTASFKLHDLLDGLAALFEKEAGMKKLNFSLSIGDSVPETIATDPSRLRQIMQNLIANAIKFTESGSVNISVRILSEEAISQESVPMMVFHVSDTGIGISRADQHRLFQEFSQVDTNLDRRFGGSGLGLAITARLVMLMGGKIGCHSTLGVGSTFWFTLPVKAHGIAPEKQESKEIDLLPISALLVEDSLTNQMVATAMLEKVGCKITIANNGFEAVEKVQNSHFDIVLMDVSMPRMDGLEATRQIRALGGHYQALPILAMTAHAFAHDRDACLEAGMNDYLSKPLNREQLYALLKQWTLHKGMAEMKNEDTASLGPTMIGTTKPIIDETIIQTLLNDISPDMFRQLVVIFLQESKDHLDALIELIQCGDIAASAKHAHAIKSSAGALGAVALQDMCGQLEIACRESKPHVSPLLQATTNVAEASWQALRTRLN
jgi:signal transduction histidine kinase/HPt (histidine-containing phosphotransfer) domain-containing protein/ActR/RegA family two-component response regulator